MTITGMDNYCCEKFAEEAQDHAPSDMAPGVPQFVCSDGNWHIHGCCGGGCYVVTDMKFCPFCGTKLKAFAVARGLPPIK